MQLRLEGIDAPETHYQRQAQPLADPARDRLLELCGFRAVRHDDQEVIAAQPTERLAAMLGQMADANGRPVVLLLTEGTLPADGSYVAVDDALLGRTINRTPAETLGALAADQRRPRAARRTTPS